MQQSFKAQLKSQAPLLLNNGRLANPLDPVAKNIKKFTSKRHKTDADLEEISRLEWYGSLYLKHSRPCIPGVMIDACLINAAKKTKKGMQAKAGLFSVDDFSLIYSGPQEVDTLWQDASFRFVANCRPQGRGTVLRTRPIFQEWSLEVEVAFNDELLNDSDIEQFFITGGHDIGLGNWRPRYGRFDLVRQPV